ncbi:hypothetical protein LXL04_008967 [Taraxacum kok-saghyz]
MSHSTANEERKYFKVYRIWKEQMADVIPILQAFFFPTFSSSIARYNFLQFQSPRFVAVSIPTFRIFDFFHLLRTLTFIQFKFNLSVFCNRFHRSRTFLQSISRHFNWKRYSTHELHKPKAAIRFDLISNYRLSPTLPLLLLLPFTGFAAGSTDGRVALKYFNPSRQNTDG